MPAKGPVVLMRFWSKSPSYWLYLAHARVPLPAQAEVEGEIGLDFPVVLNEGLRALQPHAGQALILRGPGIDVAEQEIREARARGSGIQRSVGSLRLRCIVR